MENLSTCDDANKPSNAKEIAKFYGKSLSWVYKHKNELGVEKLGGSLFFPEKEELYERLFCKKKGWRYDFTLNGERHTATWFKTKTDAKQAEARKRAELKKPVLIDQSTMIQTDITFLTLVNKRLDHVKAYNSERHYSDHIYMARRWIKEWDGLTCIELQTEMIRTYVLKRYKKTSGYTANKDLRLLRALFNFAMHPSRNWLSKNPTKGIDFFPVEKKIKYVPPKEDVLRVIFMADASTRDYLWAIALTMGRMSEVNRLLWQDVNFEERSVILSTRKKRGGHLTPRKIPMCDRLYNLLKQRYNNRDKRKNWVFWHRYYDRKKRQWVNKPYKDRSQIMRNLCKKAKVSYFRFHALRHFGASMLDREGIPIGIIQRILGHENRTTTEIYLHSIGNAERDAIEVFDRQFFDEASEKVSHGVSHKIKGATVNKL